MFLFCDDIIKNIPQFYRCYLIDFDSWLLGSNNSTIFRTKADVGKRDGFNVTEFPRTISTENPCCLDLWDLFSKAFFSCLLLNLKSRSLWAEFLCTLSSYNGSTGRVTLSEVACRRISIEFLSFANIANFKVMPIVPIVMDVPRMVCPKKVQS